MSDIVAILILVGFIIGGTIVLCVRCVQAKVKVIDAQWELEREDLVQIQRRD